MGNPAQVAHGPMLIGFTLNVILYGIMIMQVYLYFTTSQRDRPRMQILVLVLLVADTVNTIFNFLYLYNSLIINYGNLHYLETADWLFAAGDDCRWISLLLVDYNATRSSYDGQWMSFIL
ncbi:hypothetical protein FA15DRAFT_384666 [Coprinopsis marcescibilis]|uniref:Uncharacterized protein n=1 Tax=Coprinopsis marcescibilis TaxID=230819 RepID=A0A5C3KXW1_COPMA|nr:hypothetical protein FA15DRAFT_384666 [Coprinopsis marcescibilis]